MTDPDKRVVKYALEMEELYGGPSADESEKLASIDRDTSKTVDVWEQTGFFQSNCRRCNQDKLYNESEDIYYCPVCDDV